MKESGRTLGSPQNWDVRSIAAIGPRWQTMLSQSNVRSAFTIHELNVHTATAYWLSQQRCICIEGEVRCWNQTEPLWECNTLP